jgi:uncharacterized membrane protein (DUF106 family)
VRSSGYSREKEQPKGSPIVGFVLSILFAFTMGIAVSGALTGVFTVSGQTLSPQTIQKINAAAMAAGFAGIVAWAMQHFVAHRAFFVRFLYGFVVFLLVFAAMGALVNAIRSYADQPGADWSLTALYGASLNQFYTFALDLLFPPPVPLAALLFAAGLFLAAFGPVRRER